MAGILAIAVGPTPGVAHAGPAAVAPAPSGTRPGPASSISASSISASSISASSISASSISGSTSAPIKPAPTKPAPIKPAPSPPEDRGADPPLAPISPEAATIKPLDDPRRTGQDQPSLVAPPNNVSPVSTTAGMGGRTISANDPEAKRARAELEGTALSSDKAALADVPARLPPLQRGAWWSMFGAFALASTGGVFAGLAEVQEDKAERLAITLDTNTGMQLPYADIQGEYGDILRVGRRDAGVARGFLAGGAGFLVAGVTLFIVHAVRVRKADSARDGRSARIGMARGGLEVRF